MNDAFNWWMLIVGLVVGAGLVWLVLADGRRSDADVAARERASEARWIAETLRATGRGVDAADTLDVLRLHEAYLAAIPPDELDEEDDRDEGSVGLAGNLADEAGPWRQRASAEPPPAPSPTGAVAPGLRAGVTDSRAPMAHPIAPGDGPDRSTRDR